MSQGNQPGEFDSGRPAPKTDTLGLLGIIFGGAAIASGGAGLCCPFISAGGILVAIAGIICALKGRPEKKTIGLVLSALGLLISIVMTIYMAIMITKAVNDPEVQKKIQEMQQQFKDQQKQK